MKYYVNIYSLSAKNNAQKAVREEIVDKYTDYLINDNDGKADFMAMIRHKVSEINAQYPQCKNVMCEGMGNYLSIGEQVHIRFVPILGEFNPLIEN